MMEVLNINSSEIASLNQSGLFKKYFLRKIKKLAGDASSRVYYRAFSREKSFILCFDCNFLKTKQSSFIDLNKVFLKSKIAVPLIVDIDEENGLILQEDLGDETLLKALEQRIKKRPIQECLLKQSIDELSKINKISHKTELEFSAEKLYSEIEVTSLNLFVKLKEIPKDHLHFKNDFKKICEILDEPKKVYCHRDYHSKNIMIFNKKARIIDYQDARFGIPQYDLVSLLEDCYLQLEDSLKESLKKYYWDHFLKSLNYQNDFEEFLYLYDMMSIQRIFKAMGSFALIYNRDNNSYYLQYLEKSFMRMLNILNKYSEFKELRCHLHELYFEN